MRHQVIALLVIVQSDFCDAYHSRRFTVEVPEEASCPGADRSLLPSSSVTLKAAAAEVLAGRGWLYLLHRRGVHGSAAGSKPPKWQGLRTDHSHSRNLALLPKDCSEHVQLSASRSWFWSLYSSLAVPGWYSLSQASRWTVPTTVTCCYRRRCCPPFAQSQAIELFISQQDSGPVHHARETVSLLERETPRLIGPDLWPQIVQIWTQLTTRYGMWMWCRNVTRSERVHKLPIKDASELKQRLIEAWSAMQQCVIDNKAIDE